MRHAATRPPDVHHEKARLSGDLGVWSIVAMVVAAAAPLTVIAGVVPLGIALGNGAAFPATFVLCTVLLLVFCVGYTRMSPYVRDAGAFSTYIRAGLGRAAGSAAAHVALVTYTTVLVGLLGYFGSATADLADRYTGARVPWWIWSVVAAALVAFFGFRRIELSGKVLGLLLLCEVTLLLVLDLVVVVDGGPQGRSTALVDGAFLSGSLGIAIMFAVTSFIGFEATAVYRDEARDPDRTVPRATYLSLVLVGGFYAVTGWALVTAWGDGPVLAEATARPGTLLVTTLSDRLGDLGGRLGGLLLVSSIFAAILSFHNVATRYLFTLARDGGLPARLGRLHPGSGSPRTASLGVSLLTVALLALVAGLGWDPVAQVFAWLVGAATVGILVLLTVTSVSMTVFFRRLPPERRSKAATLAPPIAAVGLGGALVLTITRLPVLTGGSTTLTVAILGVLLSVAGLGALAVHRSRNPADDLAAHP